MTGKRAFQMNSREVQNKTLASTINPSKTQGAMELMLS